MSKETISWLCENVLVGFTASKGNAWHASWAVGDDLIASQNNHFEGAIPLERAEAWFNFEPVEMPLYIPSGINEDGTTKFTRVPNKKAIVPSDDPSHVFGVFSESYQPHGYRQWLLENVAELLGGENELGLGSVGFLNNRAVAWVEITLPDTLYTPEGMDFRPNLIATTSFNGKCATTYSRCYTRVVCDNTRDAALAERGAMWKNKHSKNSAGILRVEDAREQLALFSKSEQAIREEIARLASIEVTRRQFDAIVARIVGEPAEGDRAAAKKNGQRRELVTSLYLNDNRCEPWAGTALGVDQAFNTVYHWFRPTRGDTVRDERNRSDALTGKTAKHDNEVWEAIVAELGLVDA